MTDFYIIVKSDSCSNIYPNNTSTKFRVNWENDIKVEGDWEASLTSLSIFRTTTFSLLNKSFVFFMQGPERYEFKIDKDKNIYHLINLGKMRGIGYTVSILNNKFVISSPKPFFTVKFKTLSVANKYGFARRVIPSGSNNFVTAIISFVPIVEDTDLFSIWYNEDNEEHFRKLIFEDDIPINSLSELRNYMLERSSILFKDIIIEKNHLSFILQKDVTRVYFEKELSNHLNIPFKYFYSTDTIKTGKIKSFERKNYQIYVYSDLIEPIIVGDTKAPLLRTVWVEEKHVSPRVTFVPLKHPMYLPLSKNSINNFEFILRNDVGKSTEFFDRTNTVLTIHLRKNAEKEE